MADSSTSSLTSTSHTLSAVPAYGGSMASGSTLPSLGDIASALAFRDTLRQQVRRESLLKPSSSLSVAATQIAQVALGTFAGQISDDQQERIRQMHAASAARKKRKRNSKQANGTAAAADDDSNDAAKAAIGPIGPVLKIRRVHVDGFEIPQIWQQANRILETSAQQTKFGLQRLDEEDGEDKEDKEDKEDEAAAQAAINGAGSDEEDVDESGDEDEDSELDGALDGEDEEEDDEELSMGEDGEDDFDMDDEEEDDEEEDDEDDEDDELENGPIKEFVEDAGGLNDGFFDIDEFNKQSQWFEAQDARADPNTDAASEDGELDWHADPFAATAANLNGDKEKTKGKAGKKSRDQLYSDDDDNDDEDAEDDEDDGPPIFGDMDLDAPSGESDAEDMDDGGLASGMDMDLTANDIFYKDFFAPPAEKRERGDRDRPGRRSRAAAHDGADKKPFQPDDEDVQRAMNDVRRDLFEQLSDASGDDDLSDLDDEDNIDALSDVSAGDVRSRRSAHERRQAKILAEIRRLEAEAIKEKKWTLSGEATAGARPVNSLLEEDLDFEHIGKPVPVITQEVTEDIEALVKRRILEQSFDEVRRRYGTGFGEDESAVRRGLVDLDDQQSKKGLADIYEEHYQAAANPDSHVSQSDERQQGEEREVERLWLEISAKLDALSNWQYKPRPVAQQMSVVSDVAAVTMEDAQPSTAQGVSGGASMLAPQEVYKPGADDKAGKNKDNNIIVVAKSGLPVSRDEMTREEKQRRRRRNKERIRKSGSGSGMQNGDSSAAGAAGAGSGAGSGAANMSQKETMATLQKAGVKVIGKKGELHDLEGNKPRAAQALSSNNFKL